MLGFCSHPFCRARFELRASRGPELGAGLPPSPGPAPVPMACVSFPGVPLCPVPGVWPVRRAWEGRTQGKATWVARAGCVFTRRLPVEAG